MYERLENCPSCQHPQFDNYLICKDHSVSGESFAIVKCKNCELVFTNPRPSRDELKKYYQSDLYISHTNKGNSLINFLYKIVRSYTLRRKRKLIERYKSKGTILDYGCGTGDFLRTLEKGGWDTFGVEPDSGAKEISSKKISGSVVSTIKGIDSEIHFDVITAWHVVEHISDLRETLKLLRKPLKKGGYMIVAVPNLNSFDASFYKEHWAAYDVPRHLYHFNKFAFKNLAEKLNFKLVKVLPMKFDSFYVSMLSEKYKRANSSLLRGFLRGLKSNSKASKSGEYSSLIYVLKK